MANEQLVFAFRFKTAKQKAEVKKLADKKNQSINGFLNSLVDTEISYHKAKELVNKR